MNFFLKELKVGVFLGIPIFLNMAFLIFINSLFSFYLINYLINENIIFINIIFSLISVYFFVIYHEYAHALVAKWFFNSTIDKIVLYIIGGAVFLNYNLKKPKEEFFISLAGPLSNLIAYLFFYFLNLYIENIYLMYLARINLVLAIFNLLPLYPMDGGKILRSVILFFINDICFSTRLSVRISQFLCVFLLIFSMFYFFNFILIFVLIFIFIESQNQLSLINYLEELNLWFNKINNLDLKIKDVLFSKQSIDDLCSHVESLYELKMFFGEKYEDLEEYFINLINKQL